MRTDDLIPGTTTIDAKSIEPLPEGRKAMKIREAAEQLDLSYNTIRNEIKRGRLKAYQFAGTYRILPVDLAEYRERCAVKVEEPTPKAPLPRPTLLKHLDGAQSRAAWEAQGVVFPRPGEKAAQKARKK